MLFYPPSDSLIYEEGPPNFSVIGERLARAAGARVGQDRDRGRARSTPPCAEPCPATPSCASYASVKVGDELDLDEFVALLVRWATSAPMSSTATASSAAEAGIVDVYASNEDDPLRIELFGDEIESIRHFDSATQRSIDKIESALILPAREVLMTEDNARQGRRRASRKELEAQVEEPR